MALFPSACGARCAKAILVAYNFMFWTSGCLLLAIGLWIIVDPTKSHLYDLIATKPSDQHLLTYLAYALCGLGAFILLVGFFGCCGALQESKCMLGFYFLCLFVILCAELTVGIFCYFYRDMLMTNLKEKLDDQLRKEYGQPRFSKFTESIDFLQYKYHCCGIYGHADYTQTKWFTDVKSQNLHVLVPDTCCRLQAPTDYSREPWKRPKPQDKTLCQDSSITEFRNARYASGCYDSLQNWFELESFILIIITLVLAAFEIKGMIFSICLYRSISSDPT